MRLDHLLSKKQSKRLSHCSVIKGNKIDFFAGGDALRGHTRSHPEHDG